MPHMQHVHCFIFFYYYSPASAVSFAAIKMSTTTQRQECGSNGRRERVEWVDGLGRGAGRRMLGRGERI